MRWSCDRVAGRGRTDRAGVVSGIMRPRKWPRALCGRGSGLGRYAAEEVASGIVRPRKWPRALCGRGGGLRHYAAEEVASGVTWLRRWSRALCGRGCGLGHHVAEEQLCFGQLLIVQPRARAARLLFPWGRSKGRPFRESPAFEADMISASILCIALPLAATSGYIYGEVTFASSQRTFGEEGSLFWRDVACL